MSNDLTQAAGTTSIIVTLSGKAYTFKLVSMFDLAEYMNEMRKRTFLAYKNNLNGEPVSDEITIKLAEKQISFHEAMEDVSIGNGALYMLWRSLKKTYPEMTLAQTGELFEIDKNQVMWDTLNLILSRELMEKNLERTKERKLEKNQEKKN